MEAEFPLFFVFDKKVQLIKRSVSLVFYLDFQKIFFPSKDQVGDRGVLGFSVIFKKVCGDGLGFQGEKVHLEDSVFRLVVTARFLAKDK